MVLKCPEDTFIHSIASISLGDALSFEIKCRSLSPMSPSITVTPKSDKYKIYLNGVQQSVDGYLCEWTIVLVKDPISNKQQEYFGVGFCKYNFNPSYFYRVEEGPWGTWLEHREAPFSYFACGMALRYHHDLGPQYDDRSVTAVKIIYCKFNSKDAYAWNYMVQDNITKVMAGNGGIM